MRFNRLREVARQVRVRMSVLWRLHKRRCACFLQHNSAALDSFIREASGPLLWKSVVALWSLHTPMEDLSNYMHIWKKTQ
jgi:hypothetical protein